MCLLHTVLYGAYVPPSVPGRVVSFDDTKWKRIQRPGKKPSESALEDVLLILKAEPGTWFTAYDIADMTGLHKDYSMKLLNRLASQHVLAKRKAKLHPIGLPTGMFKWMNKRA